jgi:hypothetical protein
MVSMTPIEIPISQRANLYGAAFEATLYDPAFDLSSIVKAGSQFTVDCRWYIEGPNSNMLQTNPSYQWRLQVVYESIGAGNDGVLPVGGPTTSFTTGTLDATHATRYNYTGSVNFPANTFVLGPDQQHAYHLTAILTGEFLGSPVFAGYYDLGVIQVVA